MGNGCADLPYWAEALAWVVMALLEAYLGKQRPYGCSSVVALLASLSSKLLEAMWPLHKQTKEIAVEKEIVGMPIGPEAHVDLKLKDGAVVVSVVYKGADGFATVEAGLVPDAFLDKLKAMVPGTLDDVIIEALKAALK